MAAGSPTPGKTAKAVAKNGNGTPPDRIYDLDQARVARAEKRGKPAVIRLGGVDFTLPMEMPFDVAEIAAEDGSPRAILTALLGDAAEEFFALRLSVDDMEESVAAALEVYGLTAGESAASGDS